MSTKTAPKPEAAAEPFVATGKYADVCSEYVPTFVSLDLIDPAPGNRPVPADSPDLRELAASMARQGLLQPVGVLAGPRGEPERYVTVWGHRRIAAARLLGWKSIHASILSSTASGAELVENVQRRDLHAGEVALAVARLYNADVRDVPDETKLIDVAGRIGKSVAWVRDHLYLARLPEEVLGLVEQGRLPFTHAREIAKLADPRLRIELAKEAAAKDARSLPMELDELQLAVRERLLSLRVVPWRTDVALAGVDAPACAACPSNTANDLRLFGDAPKEGERVLRPDGAGMPRKADGGPYCLNPSCFKAKQQAAAKAIAKAAAKAAKVEVPASAAALEEKRLVPAGVNPAAFVSAVRSERRPEPAKTSAPTKSGDGKKYMEPWQVENAVDMAVSQAKDAELARVSDEMRLIIKDRLWSQLGLILLDRSDFAREVARTKKPKPEQLKQLSHIAALLARDTADATLEVFKLLGPPSDYGDGGIALSLADDFFGTGYYERTPTYLDALRRATGWNGQVNKPDEKAIRATVIEDLVKKGKVAPPPTLKKGGKK